MNVDLRASAVGFGLAGVVLAGLLWAVGLAEVVDAIRRAEPAALAAVLLVAVCWLSAWGLALWTVLSGLGSSIRARSAVLVFVAATFANNVTPFGQAGGEPVAALFISQSANTEYETGLAAIASVDSINFVPSVGLASVGIAYFSTQVSFGSRLQFASYAVAVLATAVPVLLLAGWRYRYRVESAAVGLITPIGRLVGRAVPRRSPPTRDSIRARVEGFFTAIERVSGNRRGLALTFGFALAGWLCLSTSLWLSLFALGETVAYPVALVVVPVGAIAGATPLPGGLGGVETVLIALLVALGVPNGVAAAAVIIHRTATYLLPTAIGGGIAGVLGSDSVSIGA